MNIEKGRRIRVKIVLRNAADGDVIEKSVVEYFQGAGTMLPGLENQLEGLAPGAKKSGRIGAADAFGNPQLRPKKTMSRAEFPAGTDLSAGTQFTAKGAGNGQDVVIKVLEVRGDSIDVQLQHPLAEHDIDFDAEVLSVTDPSPPPLPPDALELDEA